MKKLEVGKKDMKYNLNFRFSSDPPTHITRFIIKSIENREGKTDVEAKEHFFHLDLLAYLITFIIRGARYYFCHVLRSKHFGGRE